MKKIVGYLSTLLKGMLFIGFSIQIIFGLVWMYFNFMHVQAFGEPEGVLYPLLLRVFGGVPQFLYLLQLGLAGFSARVLLKPAARGGVFLQSWRALALLTLPPLLQCHLALLPYSFVCSFTFLEVSFCRKAMCDELGVSCTELTGGAACWFVLALLLPEYGWLGGIPLVLTVLLRLPALVKQLKRMAYCLLVIAAFWGIVVSVGSLADVGEGNRDSFWFSMAHRFAWPTVWNDSGIWPEELRTIAQPVLLESTYSSGNMERLLKPAIENAVDAKQAESYYRQMALLAWERHGSIIIRQMGLDAFVYALPQVILPLQLEGRGYDSFSGRNYEIMLGKHPRIAKYYVNYGCWWFVVGFGIALLLTVAYPAEGKKLFEREKRGFLIMCALSAGTVTAYYLMRRSGMSDYKRTLAVSAIWTVWMLYCMRRERRNSGE